jgi:hypothetical protein
MIMSNNPHERAQEVNRLLRMGTHASDVPDLADPIVRAEFVRLRLSMVVQQSMGEERSEMGEPQGAIELDVEPTCPESNEGTSDTPCDGPKE